VIGTALVGTLAFAGLAFGAVKHYRGTIEQGGKVTFQTKVKHRHPKRVKRFYFYKLTLNCESGPIEISNRSPINLPFPTMKVKHRKFHGDFHSSNFKTSGHLKGKFTNHFRKAHGTLRVNGNPPGLHDCDTGIDNWQARKTT